MLAVLGASRRFKARVEVQVRLLIRVFCGRKQDYPEMPVSHHSDTVSFFWPIQELKLLQHRRSGSGGGWPRCSPLQLSETSPTPSMRGQGAAGPPASSWSARTSSGARAAAARSVRGGAGPRARRRREGAAESIERAAKKLASLKPRREVKGKVGTDFVFKKNPSYKLYHPVSAHRCDMTLE